MCIRDRVRVEAVSHGPNDDIYIGDGIGRIRRIDSATGIIDSIAGVGLSGYTGDGGPAQQARIGNPTAIRFDGEDNLYFSDSKFHVVRKINTNGVISTVAGSGKPGFSPDGTLAINASLHAPHGLAITAEGIVYVSDSYNNRVRRIDGSGTLETVAGCNIPGFAGDGDTATSGSLNQPHGLCLYENSILLISDYFNHRIRAVRIL